MSCVTRAFVYVLLLVVINSGCSSVGPKYQKPSVQTPAAFREAADWKVAEPNETAIRGKWWELYGDPFLNSLEEQVIISNQNIAASFAAYQSARSLVSEARAQYFPTAQVSPTATRQSGQQIEYNSQVLRSSPYSQYAIPFEVSWAPDLWGRVRDAVRQSEAAAQVSAADLENEKLVEQADLATYYYELRGQDGLRKLYDDTVLAYREALSLTKALYETGIDSDESVAQAQTQLDTAEAQATNLGIARAQYEHAIALLIGQPAANFTVPVEKFAASPPPIPLSVPSRLLERRPDIAAAERSMAAANAQIGVGMAAYYPNLALTGQAGYQSTVLSSLLSAPSFFWSLGSSLTETIFDGGLRSATVDQYKAAYDQSVATYRQTVLTAFQQVEDAIAGLRILEQEIGQQDTAVRSAQRYLKIATHRYRLGIDPYLDVITAQTTVLTNEQTAVTLRIQQLTTSAQLIQALGGGWDISKLPK
jgi:NodT family efflux transporter outer membrane factor (OMF) lipoprotein